ncbi:hypothetical protein Pflav_084060 [Phytohabitans flavus]|uniref:Glutamine amidotransferase type-2 domain-containing protein n=1 Tax=Phytohabitans flavus TaxID=1076124 RepID=A0A6F8Y7A6_9ACTN|nr:hypothetical protein [Phytohabitans flavus]BCB81996.1 hypothetical protein Pflav_084060 [Phytohabitans flavus]
MEFIRNLLAVSGTPGAGPAPVAPFGGAASVAHRPWGRLWLDGPVPGERGVVALALGPRDHDFRPVDAEILTRWLRAGTPLAQMAAPFAAVAFDEHELTAATDHIGLRHLYGIRGDGWAAVSTSALELARLAGAPLDPQTVGTYAVTGFHLGEATPFKGVTKLPAGSTWRLAGASSPPCRTWMWPSPPRCPAATRSRRWPPCCAATSSGAWTSTQRRSSSFPAVSTAGSRSPRSRPPAGPGSARSRSPHPAAPTR